MYLPSHLSLGPIIKIPDREPLRIPLISTTKDQIALITIVFEVIAKGTNLSPLSICRVRNCFETCAAGHPLQPPHAIRIKLSMPSNTLPSATTHIEHVLTSREIATLHIV